MHTRPHIVALARDWLGTPYHHQASLRGVGTDCVGLIRGLWRDLHGTDAETAARLHARLGRSLRPRDALEAARRHLIEIAPSDAQPGDVLVFRWRRHIARETLRHPHRAHRHDPRAGRRARLRSRLHPLVAPPPRRRVRIPRSSPSPRSSRGEGRGEGQGQWISQPPASRNPWVGLGRSPQPNTFNRNALIQSTPAPC